MLHDLPLPPGLLGGEGVPITQSASNSDTLGLVSNFSQLELERVQGMIDARRAALASAERATPVPYGGGAPAGSQQAGGVGGGENTVKFLNKWSAVMPNGETLIAKDSLGLKVMIADAEGSSNRNKPSEAQDEFVRQIAERKAVAAENPWPEECEVRVCGAGGRWQMQIELEDGRKTWVWKGGFNLYVRERLKVRIADRLGEDSIYAVVERLPDASIDPQINRVGVVEQFNALVGSKPTPLLVEVPVVVPVFETLPKATLTVVDNPPENLTVTVP